MKGHFEQHDTYRTLLFMSVGTVVIFILWALFTNIQMQVKSTGIIVPSGNSRVIQHLEGGILSEILVTEGQEVSAGDVVFQIQNSRAEADLEELRVALGAMDIKRIRLEAETQQLDEVPFTPDMIRQYPEIVSSERNIFMSRKSANDEAMKGLEKQIRQKILKLDELNSTVDKLTKELNVAQEQLRIKTGLREKAAISRAQYLQTVSEVRGFETRINQKRKEIPIVKSEIAEITNRIEEERQDFFSEVGEEMNQVKVDIRKLNERIRSYSDQVDRIAVRAPVDGIVAEVYFNTIGAVVDPGGRLAEIIPVKERLIVEGKVLTKDRGNIWINQPASVNITAYDFSIYGGLEGKLTYISANSFFDQTIGQYYEVEVELNEFELKGKYPLYAGMTAEINFLGEDISILKALLRPLNNIRSNALRENI